MHSFTLQQALLFLSFDLFVYFVFCLFQGTILDRIDYNVEQASIEVEKGLEQLQKVIANVYFFF